jgi:hypothetical protein
VTSVAIPEALSLLLLGMALDEARAQPDEVCYTPY